jgi:hypothetical protein
MVRAFGALWCWAITERGTVTSVPKMDGPEEGQSPVSLQNMGNAEEQQHLASACDEAGPGPPRPEPRIGTMGTLVTVPLI